MIHYEKVLRFLERMRSGKVCLGSQCSTLSPQVVEMMGGVGLDYVIIGMETESIDLSMLENLLRAADAAQTVPMVKIRRYDCDLVSDALNAGAPFVMVPHVKSKRELDAVLEVSRFPPRGTRGLCMSARFSSFGARPLAEVLKQNNEAMPIIPIIEDKEALGELEEMMATPGVEIFEIGPVDLSQSLGLPPEKGYSNPETWAAIERICATARKHGKYVLAPMRVDPSLPKPEVVKAQLELITPRGITLFYYSADLLVLARAYKEMLPLRDLATRPKS